MQLMSPQRKLWGRRVPLSPAGLTPLGLRLPQIGGFPLTLNVALTTVLRTNVLHCDQGSERYDSEWWCNSKIKKSKVKVYWERKCIIVFLHKSSSKVDRFTSKLPQQECFLSFYLFLLLLK